MPITLIDGGEDMVGDPFDEDVDEEGFFQDLREQTQNRRRPYAEAVHDHNLEI